MKLFRSKIFVCIKKFSSIEIVNELIEKAKLNKNELKPLVQNIYLAKSLAADDIKLLELDEEKLQYLLERNRYINNLARIN